MRPQGRVFQSPSMTQRLTRASRPFSAMTFPTPREWASVPFRPDTGRALRLGVGAAIDGKVSTGDIRRLRPGHKRNQGGNLVDRSVAVERCGGLLGRRPIARGGI